jgi:hypothetical protein
LRAVAWGCAGKDRARSVKIRDAGGERWPGFRGVRARSWRKTPEGLAREQEAPRQADQMGPRRSQDSRQAQDGPDDEPGFKDKRKHDVTGTGCSASFSAPLWQLNVPNYSATGCGSERLSTDISAESPPGASVYDSNTGGEWYDFDGTSLSSPLIAAMFALAGGSGGVEYPRPPSTPTSARAPCSRTSPRAATATATPPAAPRRNRTWTAKAQPSATRRRAMTAPAASARRSGWGPSYRCRSRSAPRAWSPRPPRPSKASSTPTTRRSMNAASNTSKAANRTSSPANSARARATARSKSRPKSPASHTEHRRLLPRPVRLLRPDLQHRSRLHNRQGRRARGRNERRQRRRVELGDAVRERQPPRGVGQHLQVRIRDHHLLRVERLLRLAAGERVEPGGRGRGDFFWVGG